MKKIVLFAIVATLGFSSCKKTVNVYNEEIVKELPSSSTPIEIKNGENYILTNSYITANSWKIIKRYDINKEASLPQPGKWKLQQSNGSNNYVIIDPAPETKYWKAAYDIGTILDGDEVIDMNIKKF